FAVVICDPLCGRTARAIALQRAMLLTVGVVGFFFGAVFGGSHPKTVFSALLVLTFFNSSIAIYFEISAVLFAIKVVCPYQPGSFIGQEKSLQPVPVLFTAIGEVTGAVIGFR